jgi:predicted ester cyclase
LNGVVPETLDSMHIAQKFEHLLCLAEGDNVVGRHTIHGTHRDELLGIPQLRNG